MLHLLLPFILSPLSPPPFAFAQPPYDCATIKCDPCLSELVPLQVIFILDASSSMEPEIRGIGEGLTTLVDEILARDIDATYTVIYESHGFNGPPPTCADRPPEILADATRNITDLQYIFNTVAAKNNIEIPGLHGKHGVWEAQIESALMSLGIAGYPTPAHGYNLLSSERPWLAPLSPLPATQRPGARTLMFIITDEDDDSPMFTENRAPYMGCGQPFASQQWFSNASAPYRQFIADSAERLIAEDVILYMFARIGCVNKPCGTTGFMAHHQYGQWRCDVSDPDYSNFDANATYACLEEYGVQKSLQGRFLQAGKTARVFDQKVLENTTAYPGVLENILKVAVAEVASCTARRKRQAAQCVEYRCDAQLGCITIPLCAAGCQQCKIDGVCYADGAPNPAASCEFCRAAVNASGWTQCAGEGGGGACTEHRCAADEQSCEWDAVVCTVACGYCNTSEHGCVAFDALATACERCLPDVDATQLTAVCACAAGACLNGGTCVATAGAANASVGHCQCASSLFGGPACGYSYSTPCGDSQAPCAPPAYCDAADAVCACDASLVPDCALLGTGDPPAPRDDDGGGGMPTWLVALLIVVGALCVIAVVAFALIFVVRLRNTNAGNNKQRRHVRRVASFNDSGSRRTSGQRSGRASRTSHRNSMAMSGANTQQFLPVSATVADYSLITEDI